jgi:hypothetical protein
VELTLASSLQRGRYRHLRSAATHRDGLCIVVWPFLDRHIGPFFSGLLQFAHIIFA